MEICDIERHGALLPALKDWEQYGDNSKILAFIAKYGVRPGYEADLLVALLQPIKITGNRRTTQKTREIIRRYVFMRQRHDLEKEFCPDRCPSVEREIDVLASRLGIEPDSLKKLIQREGLHKKRTV
ncbi:MAG: hypothetical protein Q7U66_14850 [Methylobacter sp.]|nr:hypothetical protein [Methylobacter sp.]